MDASSSSFLAPTHEKGEYEVFISFHGEDVRWGFLSHLIRALKLKQINAFDDTKLKRTEGFATELLGIVERSDISIVIFSPNYPKSEYCMIELEKIHESMQLREHRAFPVFHKVNTSVVQNLEGNYAVMEQKWRDALEIISCKSGADYKNFQDEAKLVDYVVQKVSELLGELCPNISHHERFFGIDLRIRDVEEKLIFDSMNDGVRMVGIWGMGGIGKTTIADKVFHRNKKKFQGHCFVSNVREQYSKDNGPMSLRKKIIRGLLGDKNLEIDKSPSVDNSVLRRIKRVKVLLVLDDVLDGWQLKYLLQYSGLDSRDAFCSGSRIIVTSRDRQVSKDVVFENDIYEVKQLQDMEALELLCWIAFGQSTPKQEYEDLSKRAVQYAGGVPQVLTILGSEMKRKSIAFWENALAKYSTTSPLGVQDILRININQGLDFEEKQIFLDIACFFKEFTRKYVENLLEACDFHAKVGIDRLVDKSLVKEKKEAGEVIITVHDLLEQTGREIVAEEKQSKGHGSRLWTFDDIEEALRNKKGTGNVEVMSLYDDYRDRTIEINPEAFIHMSKLRCLIFLSYPFSRSVEFLPNSIKYLHWDCFSQNSWPSNYDPEKLVELHLRRSHLREIIWSKPLPRLKRIVLSGSRYLKKISDLAMAPNLEVIDLSNCSSLVDIGPSLQDLNKLMELDMKLCESLSNLPKLPSSLVKLELAFSGLKRLPSSISSLISLEVLDLSECKSLVEIESSFGNLKNLTQLDVSGCRRLSLLPELPSSIAKFEVYESGLKLLPSTVSHLTNLKGLRLYSCRELESLPSSVCNLSSIKTLDFSECIKLQKLPQDLGNLKLLEELYVSNSGLTELPTSIQNLKNLKKLRMTGCQDLRSLPSLPSSIELFFARGCKSPFSEVKLSLVEQYRWRVHDQPTTIHRLCVDDEMPVPKWMMYSNDCGSSVSLYLKTVADSTDFIFFVVISTIPDLDSNTLSFMDPVASLTDGNLQTYQSYAYLSKEHPRTYHRNGENPCYFILWNCNIECKFVKEVSFESMNPDGIIIMCGVHPIFN